MMFDLSARLLIAYGLIALMVLAAVAMVLLWRHNTPRRRHLREKARTDRLRGRRQQATAAAADQSASR